MAAKLKGSVFPAWVNVDADGVVPIVHKSRVAARAAKDGTPMRVVVSVRPQKE